MGGACDLLTHTFTHTLTYTHKYAYSHSTSLACAESSGPALHSVLRITSSDLLSSAQVVCASLRHPNQCVCAFIHAVCLFFAMCGESPSDLVCGAVMACGLVRRQRQSSCLPSPRRFTRARPSSGEERAGGIHRACGEGLRAAVGKLSNCMERLHGASAAIGAVRWQRWAGQWAGGRKRHAMRPAEGGPRPLAGQGRAGTAVSSPQHGDAGGPLRPGLDGTGVGRD